MTDLIESLIKVKEVHVYLLFVKERVEKVI
jgi:hypothetical protein